MLLLTFRLYGNLQSAKNSGTNAQTEFTLHYPLVDKINGQLGRKLLVYRQTEGAPQNTKVYSDLGIFTADNPYNRRMLTLQSHARRSVKRGLPPSFFESHALALIQRTAVHRKVGSSFKGNHAFIISCLPPASNHIPPEPFKLSDVLLCSNPF